VLVGDGASDIKGAAVADIVFAKAALAEWCITQRVPFEYFTRLAEVHRMLASMADIA